MVFAYAEDAEAMGLWGYSVNVVPEQTWDRLARLLDELAGRGDVETILFRDLPEPAAAVGRIVDGSAAWMDASLKSADLPYHEGGYDNWFHFVETSPKLARAEQLYAKVRRSLQENSLGEPLLKLALQTFLTHQYEFGCIGIGGRELRVWSGAIAALSLLRMASAGPGLHVEDWNGDGVEEILVREGDQVVVLSPTKGRVLYWADLADQALIVGSPSSVVPGVFVNETLPPPALKFPWFAPDLSNGYAQHDVPVRPPTPLGKFLPDWVWDPDWEHLTLALAEDRDPSVTYETLTAQQGAFLDEIIRDGTAEPLDLHFTHSGVSFTAWLEPGLSLTKTLSMTPAGPAMHYRFSGQSDRPFTLRVLAEIAGDYAANLRIGRSAIEFFAEDGAAGVRTASGRMIRMAASGPGGTFSHRESFHTLTFVYSLALEMREESPVDFTLTLLQVQGK
jgi:hypothetical protein